MPIRRGTEVAEATSSRFASSRLQYLSIKDGEEYFVRFITPHRDWPVVGVHINIPTKPKPAKMKADSKWPEKMSATCANDPMFIPVDPEPGEEAVYEDGFGHCYIHENFTTVLNQWGKPLSNAATSTFALCVLRERVGKVIRDVTEEWTGPNDEKVQVPAFRMLSQQWKSFFSQVHAGAVEDEDVRTKDFLIKKVGKDFKISPMSITANHHPAVTDNPSLGTADATPSWKHYEEAIALTGADLEAAIHHQGSEAWMKLWFWPGEWDELKPEDTEAEDAGSQLSGISDLTPEQQAQMAEYMEKLRKGSTPVSS